jgi:hypothetical protein
MPHPNSEAARLQSPSTTARPLACSLPLLQRGRSPAVSLYYSEAARLQSPSTTARPLACSRRPP